MNFTSNNVKSTLDNVKSTSNNVKSTLDNVKSTLSKVKFTYLLVNRTFDLVDVTWTERATHFPSSRPPSSRSLGWPVVPTEPCQLASALARDQRA